MKHYKSTIICTFLCLFSWGVASGVKYVAKTVGVYSGACEKLPGFPGVLQAAGFVPKGNCNFGDDDDKDADAKKDKGKHHQCPPSACTTASGKKGKCGPDSSHRCKRHNDPVCVCQVVNVSRDNDDNNEQDGQNNQKGNNQNGNN